MDEKKLNRILRFIEQEGLTTVEHEYLLATLNRLYVKHLFKIEAKISKFSEN